MFLFSYLQTQKQKEKCFLASVDEGTDLLSFEILFSQKMKWRQRFYQNQLGGIRIFNYKIEKGRLTVW